MKFELVLTTMVRAACRHQVHLIRPHPDAVGERDPFVDEPDLVQVSH
jgi:hypothetical protein